MMNERDAEESLVRVNIVLPKALDDRFRARFNDPLFNRTAYGARSRILQRLLEEYLNALDAGTRKLDPRILGLAGEFSIIDPTEL